jgi:hypothetical protein
MKKTKNPKEISTRRLEEVRELATVLAGYAILYPAVSDLDEEKLEELEPIEIDAKAIRNKIGRIIRSNLWKPDISAIEKEYEKLEDIKHIEKILPQYKKDGVAPTRIMAEAHAMANNALEYADKGTINNFVCGIGVFSAYMDLKGPFRRYPVVGKGFVFEASDAFYSGLKEALEIPMDEVKKKVKHSSDVAETVVRKILKSHPYK